MNTLNSLKRAVAALLFGCLCLVSCKEEEKPLAENPFTARYAGQYLVREEGNTSRTESYRYVLSRSGQAERHRLIRNSRFAEFRLDSIVRGTWNADAGSIDIRLEPESGSRTERYRLGLQPSQKDSTRSDSIWADQSREGRSIIRLIAF